MQTELAALEEAVGRVAAEDLYSVNTLPVYRSSACDGIAVNSSMFAEGVPDTSAWRCGSEYERADTGDDFDDRFDAVIPIEEVETAPDTSVVISPDVPVKPGWNVRPRGDSLREGELLIRAGMVIRPVDLASLAVGGISMVPVRKKPVVAFIPTGSELVPAGIAPKRGQNVDTNSVLVKTSLKALGADPLVFPIIDDDPEALKRALHEALRSADLIVLNGGTAKGRGRLQLPAAGAGRQADSPLHCGRSRKADGTGRGKGKTGHQSAGADSGGCLRSGVVLEQSDGKVPGNSGASEAGGILHSGSCIRQQSQYGDHVPDEDYKGKGWRIPCPLSVVFQPEPSSLPGVRWNLYL